MTGQRTTAIGILGAIVPMTIVLLVALATSLPWEVDRSYQFLLPMITYTFIHAFAAARSNRLPAAFVFLIGIAVDIMKSGPIGYWALVWLTGLLVVQLLAPQNRGAGMRFLSYVAAAALMMATAWIVASLYYLQSVDIVSIAIGFGGSCLVYPLVAMLVSHRKVSRLRFSERGSGT